MTGASKILVAYAAAIGLSALICAPAGAQPSNLAQVTQPGVNIPKQVPLLRGHSPSLP